MLDKKYNKVFLGRLHGLQSGSAQLRVCDVTEGKGLGLRDLDRRT